MKKNKRKRVNQMRCPYCGATAVLRTADGIYYDNSRNVMLYVCSNYPQCDAYVRVHPGTNKPVGTMATTLCARYGMRRIGTLIGCTRMESCQNRRRTIGSPT